MRKVFCIIAALISLFVVCADTALVYRIAFYSNAPQDYPVEYLLMLVFLVFNLFREGVKLLICLEISCLYHRQHDFAHIYDSPGILLIALVARDQFEEISRLPAPSRINWASTVLFSDIPSLLIAFWHPTTSGGSYDAAVVATIIAAVLSLAREVLVLRHINHVAYLTATGSTISWLYIDTGFAQPCHVPRYRYLRVCVFGDFPPVAKEVTVYAGETATLEILPGIHSVKVSLGALYPFAHAPKIIEGSGSKARTIEFRAGRIQKINVGFQIDYSPSRKRWEGGCVMQVKSVLYGPLVKPVFERRNWLVILFGVFSTQYVVLFFALQAANFEIVAVVWAAVFWMVPVAFLVFALQKFYIRFGNL